jgi:hypothetical protein
VRIQSDKILEHIRQCSFGYGVECDGLRISQNKGYILIEFLSGEDVLASQSYTYKLHEGDTLTLRDIAVIFNLSCST